MDDILVTKRIGANRTVCLSTLARSQVEACPEYQGDHYGYFIYELDHSRPGGLHILARVLSFEAAMRILEVLEQALAIVPDQQRRARRMPRKHALAAA